jgi:hypothetical protein
VKLVPPSRNRPGTARPSLAGSNGGGAAPFHRSMTRVARQRRWGRIAAGVAAVALALLINVYLFQSAGHRVLVVRMARDVPIGQQISRADVSTARVATDAGVATIPGRQLGEVLGRRAAVDLRAGTLLTASQITTQLTPQRGQVLVTVALKPSQLPPDGLAPGSQIRVVTTPQAQDGGSGQDVGGGQDPTVGGATAAGDVSATVDQVAGPDADGVMTVSLLVSDAAGDVVARQASTGRIALVITTRAGG